MSYNLIENFKEQGWEFLIPKHLEKTVTGEYVDPETLRDEEEPWLQSIRAEKNADKYGDYEPEVWDDDYEFSEEYYEEVGEEDGEEEERQEGNYIYDRPETLYDLKYALDYDMFTDEEFLSLSAGDILGISNSQLKFVNQNSIQSAGIGHYKDMLAKKTDIASIERRIKFVNVLSMVSFGTQYLPWEYHSEENIKKLDKYIENIIYKHSEEDAAQLLSWYKDYLGMIVNANITNEEHKAAGEQYYNYELFPKPSHIKDLHDKASRDYTEYISKKAAEHKEATNKMISDFISTRDYKRFLYKGEKYSVIPVESVDAIIDEGKALKHCVANYIEDFSKARTYLYFIRNNEALDRSLYTVEILEEETISVSDKGRMYLNQCYGYNDTTEKSDELRAFIHKWCKEKKLGIDCPI